MALSKNDNDNAFHSRASLRRKRKLKQLNPGILKTSGTGGRHYVFENSNIIIEFLKSEHIPVLEYQVISQVDPWDELREDEDLSSDIIELVSAQSMLLNNHVVMTFPIRITKNGYYRCYQRESEHEKWREIPREAKAKTDVYMQSIPGYVIVYTKHFTQFVCTCQRYPSELGLDLVVIGRARSACSKLTAYEIEITVHAFDRKFNDESSEKYIEKLKKKGCHLFQVYRNVLKPMATVQVTDCIVFSVDICSSSWTDIDAKMGPFYACAEMHHLAECHTRGYEPGTEAAQFILQTEEKTIDEASLNLKVYHSTKKENVNPENSGKKKELLQDSLPIYLSEEDTDPLGEITGAEKTAENQETHNWGFKEESEAKIHKFVSCNDNV